MKKITLVLLFLSLILEMQAQNISYKFSKPFALPKNHKDIGFFGSENDGFVQLSFDIGSDLFSQKIDPNSYQIVSEEKMDLFTLPKNYMNEVFIPLKNNNYWFYSNFDKEKEKEILIAKAIDLKANKFSSEVKVLESNQLNGTVVSTGLYQTQVQNKYDFFPSNDSSKLMVKYVLKEKQAVEKNGIFIFDSNLKPIWGKEVEMPYADNRMKIYDYHIDNDTNVYFLVKVFYENIKKRKKKKLPTYYFELLKLSDTLVAFQKIKIEFDNKFIQSIKVVEDREKNVVIAGYYSNYDKSVDKNMLKNADYFVPKKSIDGVFIQKLDTNLKFQNVGFGFYECNVDKITAYENNADLKDNEYKEDKDDAEINYLDLDYVKFEERGNITIVGEQYHAKYKEILHAETMQVKTRINHYFEDIVVIKITPNNTIKWVVKIPKNQRHVETVLGQMAFQAKKINTWRIADGKGSIGFKDLSYHYSSKGNDDYFYYMGNNKAPDQQPATHASGSGGYLMVAKISAEGVLTKTPLFEVKDENTVLRPAHFYNLSKSKIIGLCMVYEGYSILEIKLP